MRDGQVLSDSSVTDRRNASHESKTDEGLDHGAME
jgi:hypothetical protein